MKKSIVTIMNNKVFWNKPLTRGDLLVLLLIFVTISLLYHFRGRIHIVYEAEGFRRMYGYALPHKICYPRNPNDAFCVYICSINYYYDRYSDFCSRCRYWVTHVTEERCKEMGGRWDWE